MHVSLIARATRRKLRVTPELAVLPPLPLYRRILRAHRILPLPQRILGDSYVKKEFRDHRKVDNPVQIIGFLTQWQKYLEAVLGDRWRHEKLDMEVIERMDSDRIVQLYELMMAAQNDGSEMEVPEMR